MSWYSQLISKFFLLNLRSLFSTDPKMDCSPVDSIWVFLHQQLNVLDNQRFGRNQKINFNWYPDCYFGANGSEMATRHWPWQTKQTCFLGKLEIGNCRVYRLWWKQQKDTLSEFTVELAYIVLLLFVFIRLWCVNSRVSSTERLEWSICIICAFTRWPWSMGTVDTRGVWQFPAASRLVQTFVQTKSHNVFTPAKQV